MCYLKLALQSMGMNGAALYPRLPRGPGRSRPPPAPSPCDATGRLLVFIVFALVCIFVLVVCCTL